MTRAAVPRVTTVELLDIRERQWRQRLDVVSLAAEALDAVPVKHREQALGALGRLYQAGPEAEGCRRDDRIEPATPRYVPHMRLTS
jgi:hypothetical protein